MLFPLRKELWPVFFFLLRARRKRRHCGCLEALHVPCGHLGLNGLSALGKDPLHLLVDAHHAQSLAIAFHGEAKLFPELRGQFRPVKRAHELHVPVDAIGLECAPRPILALGDVEKKRMRMQLRVMLAACPMLKSRDHDFRGRFALQACLPTPARLAKRMVFEKRQGLADGLLVRILDGLSCGLITRAPQHRNRLRCRENHVPPRRMGLPRTLHEGLARWVFSFKKRAQILAAHLGPFKPERPAPDPLPRRLLALGVVVLLVELLRVVRRSAPRTSAYFLGCEHRKTSGGLNLLTKSPHGTFGNTESMR